MIQWACSQSAQACRGVDHRAGQWMGLGVVVQVAGGLPERSGHEGLQMQDVPGGIGGVDGQNGMVKGGGWWQGCKRPTGWADHRREAWSRSSKGRSLAGRSLQLFGWLA